jgi:hypothetical protein
LNCQQQKARKQKAKRKKENIRVDFFGGFFLLQKPHFSLAKNLLLAAAGFSSEPLSSFPTNGGKYIKGMKTWKTIFPNCFVKIKKKL